MAIAASSFAFYGLNFRRQIQLAIILAVILFATCTTSAAVFYGYITLLIFLFSFLLIDYMFMNESQFKYDPDYKNWQRQQDKMY